MRLVCVSLLAVLLSACSKKDSAPKSDANAETNPPAVSLPNPPVQKEASTIETAVNGFTGRTVVNSGRKAQDKIRSVVRDRDADMKEVETFGR